MDYQTCFIGIATLTSVLVASWGYFRVTRNSFSAHTIDPVVTLNSLAWYCYLIWSDLKSKFEKSDQLLGKLHSYCETTCGHIHNHLIKAHHQLHQIHQQLSDFIVDTKHLVWKINAVLTAQSHHTSTLTSTTQEIRTIKEQLSDLRDIKTQLEKIQKDIEDWNTWGNSNNQEEETNNIPPPPETSESQPPVRSWEEHLGPRAYQAIFGGGSSESSGSIPGLVSTSSNPNLASTAPPSPPNSPATQEQQGNQSHQPFKIILRLPRTRSQQEAKSVRFTSDSDY